MKNNKSMYGFNKIALAVSCIEDRVIKENIHKAFISYLLPLNSEFKGQYFNEDIEQIKLYDEIISEIYKYGGQVNVSNLDENHLALTPSWDTMEFISKLSEDELNYIAKKINELHMLNCNSMPR